MSSLCHLPPRFCQLRLGVSDHFHSCGMCLQCWDEAQCTQTPTQGYHSWWGYFTCILWICEINIKSSHRVGDEEDSRNIRGGSTSSTHLIVRMIFWNKICSDPFVHSLFSPQYGSWNFLILFFFRRKKHLLNPRTPIPSICLHFIEWLSMCEKKTRRISKEQPHS